MYYMHKSAPLAARCNGRGTFLVCQLCRFLSMLANCNGLIELWGLGESVVVSESVGFVMDGVGMSEWSLGSSGESDTSETARVGGSVCVSRSAICVSSGCKHVQPVAS